MASVDNQIDLEAKLMLQGSGISQLLDVYSDAIFFGFILVQVISSIMLAKRWTNMSPSLKYCYLGEILFAVVATYWHSNPVINTLYLSYFMAVSAWIQYWQAQGLAEFIHHDTQVKKDLFQRAQVHNLCLATLPSLLSACGYTEAVGRFVFNGYGVFFSVIVLDPLMREATIGTPIKESLWKLKAVRVIYPLAGMALVVESYVADMFEFDIHVVFHLLIYTYVVLMNSLLNDTSDMPPSAKVPTKSIDLAVVRAPQIDSIAMLKPCTSRAA